MDPASLKTARLLTSLRDGLVRTSLSEHYSMRQTDQFSLEVIFHNKALNSAYRVSNPEDANLFYIPYYTRFVQFCNSPKSREILEELERELFTEVITKYPYWNRNGGKDHIMALGFIEREHAQNCPWCSALLLNTLTKPMTLFAIEREAKTNSLQSATTNVIAVPYPSTVHYFSIPPQQPAPSRKRGVLVSCVASDQQLPFRLKLKESLTKTVHGL